ncbi:MAG: DUF4145 domain-containing protein [Dehalococcoidia bacterium]
MPARRCPHCKALSTYDRLTASLDGGNLGTLSFGSNDVSVRFDRCRNEECHRVVAVVFDREGTEIEIFPPLEEEPDELLPSDVANAFRQALKSLNEGIWDGCVILCSRALDEATANLKAEGDSLFERLENLAATNQITVQLSEWAHTGRLAANLGRHGAEKRQEERKWNNETDAQEIVEFAKWFFRYVYILPKQLQARKARLEEGAKVRADDSASVSREPSASAGAPRGND